MDENKIRKIIADLRKIKPGAESMQAMIQARRDLNAIANSAPRGSPKRHEALDSIKCLDAAIRNMQQGSADVAIPSSQPEDKRKKAEKGNTGRYDDILSILDFYIPAEMLEQVNPLLGAAIGPVMAQPLPKSITFNSLQVQSDTKRFLSKRVVTAMNHPETGLRPASCLLYGPPGTGKTTIPQALANETNAILVVINGSTIKGHYYGLSQSRMRLIFELAELIAETTGMNMIILFDDCDTLLGKSSHSANRDIIAAFLTCLDGVGHKAENRRFSVICTTNRPEAFEENVLRRLGKRIYVGPPNAEQRLNYLKSQVRKYSNISPDIDLASLARSTRGYSCSDLNELMEEANAERIDDSSTPERILPMDNKHLIAALQVTVPTLRSNVVDRYEKYARSLHQTVPEYD